MCACVQISVFFKITKKKKCIGSSRAFFYSLFWMIKLIKKNSYEIFLKILSGLILVEVNYMALIIETSFASRTRNQLELFINKY